MSDIQPSNVQPSTFFWQGKRVMITGGAGFLGSFVTEKLVARGVTDILIPRIENYNLTDRDDIKRLLDDSLQPADKVPTHLQHSTFNIKPSTLNLQPENLVIIHLAANVGGIG